MSLKGIQYSAIARRVRGRIFEDERKETLPAQAVKTTTSTATTSATSLFQLQKPPALRNSNFTTPAGKIHHYDETMTTNTATRCLCSLTNLLFHHAYSNHNLLEPVGLLRLWLLRHPAVFLPVSHSYSSPLPYSATSTSHTRSSSVLPHASHRRNLSNTEFATAPPSPNIIVPANVVGLGCTSINDAKNSQSMNRRCQTCRLRARLGARLAQALREFESLRAAPVPNSQVEAARDFEIEPSKLVTPPTRSTEAATTKVMAYVGLRGRSRAVAIQLRNSF